MNFRILSAVTSIAMLFSANVYAVELSPMDLLKASVDESMKTISEEVDTSVHLTTDAHFDSASEFGQQLQMLSDVDLNIHGKCSVADGLDMEMLMSVSMEGMTFNIEGYLNENQLVLKIPMDSQYYVETLTDEVMSGISGEGTNELTKIIGYSLINSIPEEKFSIERNVDIVVNDMTEQVSLVTLRLNDSAVKAYLKTAITNLLSNESFKDSLANETMSKSELDQDFDIVIENLDLEWANFTSLFIVNNFEVIFALDGENRNIATTIHFDTTFTDPQTNENYTMKFDINSETYNINKNLEIAYPQITNENSKPLSELSN